MTLSQEECQRIHEHVGVLDAEAKKGAKVRSVRFETEDGKVVFVLASGKEWQLDGKKFLSIYAPLQ